MSQNGEEAEIEEAEDRKADARRILTRYMTVAISSPDVRDKARNKAMQKQQSMVQNPL